MKNIYFFKGLVFFLPWKRWFNFLTGTLRHHMPERVCLKGGVPEALCGDSDLPTGPPRGFCSIICWIKCGGAGGDCRIIGLAWGWRGWNQTRSKSTQIKKVLQFSFLIHPVQFMRPMPLNSRYRFTCLVSIGEVRGHRDPHISPLCWSLIGAHVLETKSLCPKVYQAHKNTRVALNLVL